MRYNRVVVHVTNIRVTDITNSRPYLLTGQHHDLIQLTTANGLWYLVVGTNFGLRLSDWKNLEANDIVTLEGTVELTHPTLTFPITSERDMPSHLRDTIIAYLYRGKVLCEPCSKKFGATYPDGVELRIRHIAPYSQDCHNCGTILVEIGRNRLGLDMLFKKYIAPIVKGSKR